jgi:hypothetical protein
LDDPERGEQPPPEPASPIDAHCRGDTWATFRQTHGAAVYCDATVQRWKNFTGKKAVCEKATDRTEKSG